MTRKKKDKPDRRADFRTSPFQALKGFPAAGKASLAKSAAPPPSGPIEDDDTLFRRATEGARPLRAAGSPKAAGDSAQAVQRGGARQPDDQLFLEAMRSMGTGFRGSRRVAEEEADAMHEQAAGGTRSPSSRMRQLKRGILRIGAELDLHGFFKDEAIRRLEHFLSSASARGLAAVLVITGKGTNSPEGPVLPGAVAGWLRGPGLRYAAEFHPAPGDRGGSGAFVVFLRSR